VKETKMAHEKPPTSIVVLDTGHANAKTMDEFWKANKVDFEKVKVPSGFSFNPFAQESNQGKQNPFDGMETPPIAEATKQAIARADSVMSEANLPTYSDLIAGLFKLQHQARRLQPVTVEWIHEHISPLMPK